MTTNKLKLVKTFEEDERDEVYEDIFEVAQVCGHLSKKMVTAYNYHDRLLEALEKVTNPDWNDMDSVDADVGNARALLEEINQGK